jgi:hypothetical protein
MEFLNVREFRTYPKKVWEKLAKQGEIVVTNNGKPTALMLNIENGDYDDLARAVRQARAMIALNSIRAEAAEKGFLSDEEIAAEINVYRQEKRDKK